MNKKELLSMFEGEFKAQMGLEISDILTLKDDVFIISSENIMGMSIASLRLNLSDDQHGQMAEFLALVSSDTCPTCIRGGFFPSHKGSKSCESGSIASGGDKAHCSCGVCF